MPGDVCAGAACLIPGSLLSAIEEQRTDCGSGSISEDEQAEAEESDPVPEAPRPSICAASTRGELIDPADFPDQDLKLHIGICGAEQDQEPLLEVIASSLLNLNGS